MPRKEHGITILFFVKEKVSYGSSKMKLLLDAGLCLKPAYQQNELFKTVKKTDDLPFPYCSLCLYYEKSVKVSLLILTVP